MKIKIYKKNRGFINQQIASSLSSLFSINLFSGFSEINDLISLDNFDYSVA